MDYFCATELNRPKFGPDVMNQQRPGNVRYLLGNCAFVVNFMLSPLSYRSMAALLINSYSWPEVKTNSLGAFKYI